MRNWSLIGVAIFVFGVLIYIVYAPALRPTPTAIYNIDVGPSPLSETHTLTFGSDIWPPYTDVAGADNEGYLVDLLREVYEPMGYEVRYVNRPWDRCIEMVRRGEMTGLIGAHIHEAPDLVYPHESVGIATPAFFVLKDTSWEYTGVSSLPQVRLGAIQGYVYETNIDIYIRQNQDTDRVILAKGNDAPQRLLDALRIGRIDTCAITPPVAYHVLKSMGLPPDTIKVAGTEPGLPLFIGLSPRTPDARVHAQLFDQRYVELRDSGRLKELMARYGLNDDIANGNLPTPASPSPESER